VRRRIILLAAFAVAFSASVAAQDRFPQPEFESGYSLPETQNPAPRSQAMEYVDVGVLLLGLVVSGWLILKTRRRTPIVVLSIAAIAYFGIYRLGCVCPIGAIQNVALALAEPAYSLPVTVLLFFLLPIAASLIAGRVFCGSVCPFGALQDLVTLNLLKLPRWLDRALRFLAVVYLGHAVLFAATGTDFIICRFDPFVGLFRLNATLPMLLFGAAMIVLSIFVGRPYCRYLCPYGVILGLFSRVSLVHTTITPAECVSCGLCDDSCPVDAIRAPGPPLARPAYRREKSRFLIVLAALPLVLLIFWLSGRAIAPAYASLHPEVRLLRQVNLEDAGLTTETTLASETFRASRRTMAELVDASAHASHTMVVGSSILWLFFGAAIWATALRRFVRSPGAGHEPIRELCVSCGRCHERCPIEHRERDQR